MTTPKLPPPPRSAQKRSGFSSALAVTSSPSAVTSSNDSTLSQLSPCLRTSQPTPPPSVSPATPVLETTPTGTASPWRCVSRSRSPSVAPPCTCTVRALGIDQHPAHVREVDDHAVVAERPPGDVVAAAAHRHEQVVGAGELHRLRSRRPRRGSARSAPDGGRSPRSRSGARCRSPASPAGSPVRPARRQTRRRVPRRRGRRRGSEVLRLTWFPPAARAIPGAAGTLPPFRLRRRSSCVSIAAAADLDGKHLLPLTAAGSILTRTPDKLVHPRDRARARPKPAHRLRDTPRTRPLQGLPDARSTAPLTPPRTSGPRPEERPLLPPIRLDEPYRAVQGPANRRGKSQLAGEARSTAGRPRRRADRRRRQAGFGLPDHRFTWRAPRTAARLREIATWPSRERRVAGRAVVFARGSSRACERVRRSMRCSTATACRRARPRAAAPRRRHASFACEHTGPVPGGRTRRRVPTSRRSARPASRSPPPGGSRRGRSACRRAPPRRRRCAWPPPSPRARGGRGSPTPRRG